MAKTGVPMVNAVQNSSGDGTDVVVCCEALRYAD
jgi:hypothetical protein